MYDTRLSVQGYCGSLAILEHKPASQTAAELVQKEKKELQQSPEPQRAEVGPHGAALAAIGRRSDSFK